MMHSCCFEEANGAKLEMNQQERGGPRGAAVVRSQPARGGHWKVSANRSDGAVMCVATIGAIALADNLTEAIAWQVGHLDSSCESLAGA
jgi:hypothetical protein